MIIVHHLDDSRSQRILWLLEELGLPYEIRPYKRDPQSQAAPQELRRIHPLGKSPVVEDDGSVVAESGAIIETILRRHGQGRLQPTPGSAAHDAYVYWMHYAEGSAMPALVLRNRIARLGDAAAAALPRLDGEMALHLGFIDASLAGRPYILGDDFTAADIQMSFVGELAATRYGLAATPNVDAWVGRLRARPAYRAALARGGPYRYGP